jgi:hypothetical protein
MQTEGRAAAAFVSFRQGFLSSSGGGKPFSSEPQRSDSSSENHAMNILLTFFLLLLPLSAHAQQLSPQSGDEIARLISFAQTSSCQFNRNGSWHSSDEAAAHIRRKYQAALDKGLIHSAEDFIRAAASKSSLSGAPYTVRCQGGPVIRCADWLTAELRRIRGR